MNIKHFVAAGFVLLPVLTMLGNGCTVHQAFVGLDLDGGEFGGDGSTKSDAGRKDSGSKDGATTGDGSAMGCAPGDVSGLGATFKQPTALHQGLCTATQVSTLIDCLNNIPDATTCKTFLQNAANTSCIGCAITKATAASYGPLVEGTVTININVAGCVARETGDLTSTGCGAKMSAATQCEQLACEANCPVPATDTGAAFNALLQCQQDSSGSVCKSYADAALCADALVDGGTASACANAGADFSSNAKAMVTLFCGI